MDIVARELGVKASTLARPWDLFLRSGEEGLKSRPGDPQVVENERLKAKIGELTQTGELLEKKIGHSESGVGPPGRRSRKKVRPSRPPQERCTA